MLRKSKERPSIKALKRAFKREESKVKQNGLYERTKPKLSFEKLCKKYCPKIEAYFGLDKDIEPFENEKEALIMLLDMAIYSLKRRDLNKTEQYLNYLKNGGYEVKE